MAALSARGPVSGMRAERCGRRFENSDGSVNRERMALRASLAVFGKRAGGFSPSPVRSALSASFALPNCVGDRASGRRRTRRAPPGAAGVRKKTGCGLSIRTPLFQSQPLVTASRWAGVGAAPYAACSPLRASRAAARPRCGRRGRRQAPPRHRHRSPAPQTRVARYRRPHP